MRSFGTTVAVAIAGLLFFTQFALASEEEEGNALSSMLENTSIDGWVAASYNYNFEGFDGNQTGGQPLSGYENTNSFQLDQAWISIDNAATEDSRGGAHLDYQWGTIGGDLDGNLFSAYVSYLAPVGDGVNLDLGLLPTMIGAEVPQTNANFNITRGLVWEIQPVTNVGAVFSTDFMGFGVALGILNDTISGAVADNNNEKALTAQISKSGDDWSATGTIVWGDEGGVDTGFYDLVLTCDGMESVSAWFNYTLVDADDIGQIHGIALAARMALNDDMGVALRGEVRILDLDGFSSDSSYSITATGDYALTSHLQAKAEIRIDIDADGFKGSDGTPGDEDVSALILAQLVYTF
ncbi:MAG: outer membrane beta-barrel protein [Myxococcales bacterium]|nr:outer membrane beta-barrel protein [Myxococcales bacterium]